MSEADQSVSPVVKKHKRGDVREDGKVFHHYYRKNGNIYEYWVSPKKLIEDKRKQCECVKNQYRKLPTEERKKRNRLKYLKVKSNPEAIEKQRLARMA